MVRYFYLWVPPFLIGTLCILALPWLGLIALMIVARALVTAIALVFVYVPYGLGRAMSPLTHSRGEANPRPAAVVAVATRQPAYENGRAS
jgi:hypothetical protein